MRGETKDGAVGQLGEVYILGVRLGVASFHATAGNRDAARTLLDAREAIPRLTATGISIDFSTLSNLARVSEERAGDSDWLKNTAAPALVSLRGEYQGRLEGISKRLGGAFILGVSMGIAEGQSTAGEAARDIVFSSLTNALPGAQALALDTGTLEHIRGELVQGAPLNHIYGEILQLSSYFRGSLDQLSDRPPIRLPGT